MGPSIQFLTPLEEGDDTPCLMRGTIPPGVAVPLHSHADSETLLQVSSEVEALELMTRDVRVARPDQSIQDAARLMLDADAAVVPVGDNDRLVVMITDRDIAVRAIAQGKGPEPPVRR